MLCTKESNGIIDFVRVTKVGSVMIFHDISFAIFVKVWSLNVSVWIFQAGMVHSELFLALVRAPEDWRGEDEQQIFTKLIDLSLISLIVAIATVL